MRSTRLLQCLALLMLSPLSAQEQVPGVQNVIIHLEKERCAGWPANNGAWSWGDEIVIGYVFGWHEERPGALHTMAADPPQQARLARSLDGGATWTTEIPSFLDVEGKEAEPSDSPGSINFAHPDFALMMRMVDSKFGYSRFYYSYDRCKTWAGPFNLPAFGRQGVFARTDYIVNGKDDCLIFITAAEDGGGEGWPLCARTTDGGKTWEFQGWIGKQPEEPDYRIMPATVRLGVNDLLTATRCRNRDARGEEIWGIEMYLSPDNGKRWYQLEGPHIDHHGNPASLITLQDGRLVLTYGYRREPFGIRGVMSADQGRSWGNEFVLRDDADLRDLGYPRSVQRADGKCVTAYYFKDANQKERYVACTIWDPVAVKP